MTKVYKNKITMKKKDKKIAVSNLLKSIYGENNIIEG